MRGMKSRPGYRRGSFGRRKLKTIIIISVSALLVLALLFLVIGNLLNNKTSGSRDDDDDIPPGKTTVTENTHVKVKDINAYPVLLDGLTQSGLGTEVSRLLSQNITAVSLSLCGSGGELLYNSQVAQRFGYQSASSGKISLQAVADRLSSNNIYVSGCLDITSFSEENDVSRSVLLSYEAAIACEAYRAGLNDIVLRCRALSVDGADELTRLVGNIKNVESRVVVGFALTPELLGSENSAELVAKLWEEFDFLALDLSALPVDENLPSAVGEALDATLYYTLRYGMRVLLPYTEDTDIAEKLRSAVQDRSISNWQIAN